MMFAQVNSEPLPSQDLQRPLDIDGQPRGDSLFDLIRSTHAADPMERWSPTATTPRCCRDARRAA